MAEMETKTITIEDNDNYKRVRTQCDDQNYVREYFMSRLSHGAAIAACSYLIDMLMDISILNLGLLEGQANLTAEQKANFEKLKKYHSFLKSTSLKSDSWQMDWVYLDVKHQQDAYSLQFFDKRSELQLGDPLPSPEPNPVPDIMTILNG